MWRPKDWGNPNRIEIVNSSEGGEPTAYSAYEVGADAMLQGVIAFLKDVCYENGLYTGLSYADFKTLNKEVRNARK